MKLLTHGVLPVVGTRLVVILLIDNLSYSMYFKYAGSNLGPELREHSIRFEALHDQIFKLTNFLHFKFKLLI